MITNEGPRFVLQARDLHLLRELQYVRILDREQAKTIAGFGSGSRTNRRLHKLVAAGLLRRFFLGTSAGGAKALYSLSESGARLAEVPYRGFRRRRDQALIADFFVQHQLAVNEVYCALKYGALPASEMTFKGWISFQEPIWPGLALIPDGYFEFQTSTEIIASFLEVDLGHERLKVWKQKIENYFQLALSERFPKIFGQRRFRTLIVANSTGRMLSIRKVVAPITDKIFWFSDVPAIHREGIFGSIWLRPRDDKAQPLFRENL